MATIRRPIYQRPWALITGAVLAVALVGGASGTVWTGISAVQTDGSVRTYSGTYTVANGQIVSANNTQTS